LVTNKFTLTGTDLKSVSPGDRISGPYLVPENVTGRLSQQNFFTGRANLILQTVPTSVVNP